MMYNDYMKKAYNESSLNRVWSHNKLHDCGAISAFRKYSDCDGSNGEVLSKKDNLRRNKILVAKLLSNGYSVTRLIGKYPEGGEEKKEVSYFVVDVKDKGTLKNDLIKLGKEFNQDSVLYIPKGAIDNEATAYLIGTNHCPNNFLGFGDTEEFEKGRLGAESKIYTSYVNGKPFIFEGYDRDFQYPGSGYGNWIIEKYANKKI